jgi:flagellar basal body-associated protein FliL
MGRFDLGEFIATSRDDELHYIKIQVVVGYIGNLEQELEESKAELRDAIITILMKLNIQRAKEDYIDKFLHKDIETELNRILGKTTSESRIIRVFIPTFLIN